MLTLGIDPGTATTGFALVREEHDEYALVDCGVILTSPDEPMPRRLLRLHSELSGLIAASKPDAVAVEELFFNKNVRTAIAVGQARGVILLAAAQADAPAYEYTPLQVKQAVVGYGRAEKHQVQEMVRLLLGLDEPPQPDDAADAVAVALCHLQSARIYQRLAESARHKEGQP
jgi:crossover junction endodeoxyribonuclease RuvC